MKIEFDENKHLKDPFSWNKEIALTLATEEHITLSAAHWQIIHFLREFYLQHQHVPPQGLLVRAIKKNLGVELGSSAKLHQLFPNNTMRTLCRIAGLPKPEHCL